MSPLMASPVWRRTGPGYRWRSEIGAELEAQAARAVSTFMVEAGAIMSSALRENSMPLLPWTMTAYWPGRGQQGGLGHQEKEHKNQSTAAA